MQSIFFIIFYRKNVSEIPTITIHEESSVGVIKEPSTSSKSKHGSAGQVTKLTINLYDNVSTTENIF